MGSYRDNDIDRMVLSTVPRVQAGQMRVANLTSAYVSQMTGTRPAPVDPALVTGGRGVSALEVYRRPATTLYTKLSEGVPYERALLMGGLRLAALVAMDLQMAKVRQFQESAERSGVRYFRRVLTGAENCALCAIASTQRYSVGNLMPIHPGCDCGVMPLADDAPVSQDIDPDLLGQTHGHVAEFAGVSDAGGRAPDYRKLIITKDHGEHGPSLRWTADAFTGPDDI